MAERLKDTIADEIIAIINNLKYKQVGETWVDAQNDMIDTVIRHIEYYKKGDYNEWLKNRNTIG